MARALDLERANATPDRYVEVTTSVAAPLVTTSRSPREVPSICRATLGGGAAHWQTATAGGRVGRRFGVEPTICAMAGVTYESKRQCRPQVLGGPLRPLRHPDRPRPAAASTRGSSPRVLWLPYPTFQS
jgi:hypothetical protein